MGAQDLLNSFYNIDNLVTVNITLPEADWQAILNAEPKGKFGYKGSRFDWYKAASVTVSGTKFPKEGTFKDVGIIKKSFWGSFSKVKPSLKLDFERYNEDNEDAIENLIGTHRMTLNNSIQDPSYIRQPLGYELFRQAGVPNFRCNLAKVIVNSTTMGVYVNLEPMQKKFVENRFNGNTDGNAYEIEWIPDLLDEIEYIKQGYVSFEGFSDYEDEKDLNLAADYIAHTALAGAEVVVDMGAFMRFFAMESLLKHWDGYSHGLNNTYMYNDVEAVAKPTTKDVKLKFIPSGIDQILQRDRPFEIGNTSRLAKLLLNPLDDTKQKLFAQILEFATKIFGEENYDSVLKPFVERLEAVIMSADVELNRDFETHIDIVRDQLQMVRTAMFTIQDNVVILNLADE